MSVEKLREELTRMVDSGLKNIHIGWGDEAPNLTPDERASAVLDLFDEMKKWDALPTEEKMREQITQVYGYLKEAIQECKFDLNEVVSDIDGGHPRVQELSGRLSRVFGALDMSLVLLGNWIEPETRLAIAKKGRVSQSRK